MPAKLTAQDIYDKEFTVDARGYSANEVDSYLDQIIEDYQDYEEQTQKLSSALVSCDQRIKELTDENAALRQNEESLNRELDDLHTMLQTLQQQTAEANRRADEAEAALNQAKEAARTEPLSLEERVARLEKAVFHPDAD